MGVRHMQRYVWAGLFGWVFVAHGTSADAADNGSASGASAAAPPVLEEIIVTSRKRVERVQEVPEAISVFGASALEGSGIRSIVGVATHVPTFSIVQQEQPGTEAINIRGVGQVRNCEPPVAVVVHGVQLASGFQITPELFDIDQIE